jgi:hypothetical protein
MRKQQKGTKENVSRNKILLYQIAWLSQVDFYWKGKEK